MQDSLRADISRFDAQFVARAACTRFVLVAPSHPGNIGASARAIRAMGFARLSVVNPREPNFADDAEATAFATHAVEVLRAARTEVSLTRALHGTQLALAMTGYAREFGPPLLDLRTAAVRAAEAIDSGQQVAFVFGAERSGLSNDDIERCTVCCAIPADPTAASLNLAQAVQVVAYEMQLALRRGAGVDPLLMPFSDEVAAPVDQVEAMVAHFEEALVAIGYLDLTEPRRLMSRLRRLFSRAQPTVSEIDILRGIAAAMIVRKSERIGRKISR